MTDNSGDTGAVRGGQTGAPAEPDKAQPTSRASALFDLRKIIGGMLSVYGVVLIIVGLLDGKKQLDKADGIPELLTWRLGRWRTLLRRSGFRVCWTAHRLS